jgi:hypothetical protein
MVSAMTAKRQLLDPSLEGQLARAKLDAAYMSDTKRRKLISGLSEAAKPPDRMVVKFIDVEEPRVMRFPPSLAFPRAHMDTIEFGPVALRSIEWMELEGDFAPEIDALGRFPIAVPQGLTRVTGCGLPTMSDSGRRT